MSHELTAVLWYAGWPKTEENPPPPSVHAALRRVNKLNHRIRLGIYHLLRAVSSSTTDNSHPWARSWETGSEDRWASTRASSSYTRISRSYENWNTTSTELREKIADFISVAQRNSIFIITVRDRDSLWKCGRSEERIEKFEVRLIGIWTTTNDWGRSTNWVASIY